MFQQSPDAFATLKHKVDILWASSFLHLFSWADQLTLCIRITAFLQQKPGSMVLGRQLGSVVPGCYSLQDLMTEQPYWHDPISFERLWEEVGKATKTKWKVEATLDEVEFNHESCKEWGHPAMRRLLFAVTLNTV